MKTLLRLMSLIFFTPAFGQNSIVGNAIKKVLPDFQPDFNDGSFSKAQRYRTVDWVHVNPGGGITNGRANFKRGKGYAPDHLKGSMHDY